MLNLETYTHWDHPCTYLPKEATRHTNTEFVALEIVIDEGNIADSCETDRGVRILQDCYTSFQPFFKEVARRIKDDHSFV